MHLVKALSCESTPHVSVQVPFGHDGPHSGSKSPSGKSCRPPSGKALEDRLFAALPCDLCHRDASFQGRLQTAVLLQHPDIAFQNGLLEIGKFLSLQRIVCGCGKVEVLRPTAQHSLGPLRRETAFRVAAPGRDGCAGFAIHGTAQGAHSAIKARIQEQNHVIGELIHTISTHAPYNYIEDLCFRGTTNRTRWLRRITGRPATAARRRTSLIVEGPSMHGCLQVGTECIA